ncbi:MAG: LLM class flavin-dependent oxidoreductase [Acidimicrobiales bacterium]
MRIGITLPSFSADAGAVIDTARAAEKAGIHGVFVFDHLWPTGSPQRPALAAYPIVAAVLAATRTIRVGTLVARIGLLPDEVVLACLGGLAVIAQGRLIAGLGTGHSPSADENERLGIPYPSARVRRARLGEVGAALEGAGIETWIGAGTEETNELAGSLGATLNLWGAHPDRVRDIAAGGGAVSWAGPFPKDDSAPEVLESLSRAGATWAVWGWPPSVESVVSAAGRARIELAASAS